MVDGPPERGDDDTAKAQERRRLVRRLVGAGLLVLGLLWVYVFWVPSWMYPSLTDSDLQDVKTAQNEPDAAKIQELKGARLKLQNDARTTLLQGLGAVLVLTGAGIGAGVTLRQVRATRDQITETATASRSQLRLSEQGQVTDRYTRAVEQLGHEKAPVRLGALYSLEHLAQDNPQYRQTVVDVVCAYLRMPYTVSAQTELDAAQVEEMALSADGQDRPRAAPGRAALTLSRELSASVPGPVAGDAQQQPAGHQQGRPGRQHGVVGPGEGQFAVAAAGVLAAAGVVTAAAVLTHRGLIPGRALGVVRVVLAGDPVVVAVQLVGV